MTAASPEVDELSDLDFVPSCEAYEGLCDKSAVWIIRGHCAGCGRLVLVVFCTEHKDELLAMKAKRGLFDKVCGTVPKPAFAIDSVTTLR